MGTPVVQPADATLQCQTVADLPYHLWGQSEARQGVALDAAAEVFIVEKEMLSADPQDDSVGVLGVQGERSKVRGEDN